MKYLLFLVCLLLTSSALADEERMVTFNAPTLRADGVILLPVEEILKYKVYIDEKFVQDIIGDVTFFSIMMPTGTHIIRLKTVDTKDRESVFSEAISIDITAPPNPPTNIKVMLNLNSTGNN